MNHKFFIFSTTSEGSAARNTADALWAWFVACHVTVDARLLLANVGCFYTFSYTSAKAHSHRNTVVVLDQQRKVLAAHEK
ncbi:hypothetical protein Q5P01_015920 [Channa striata]|uniref:Uncharacterized protein n=1 Tax=Channa striata TaxID=64152 RepID=A0AA88SFV3_CHASR|nr:hypothetical protein Q5P01_015920 [Channa striata]